MTYDVAWDAGDVGCGELVVKLKLLLRKDVPAGGVVKLTATDPGVRLDLPAWCRLTGNALIEHDPPVYFIRRKEE